MNKKKTSKDTGRRIGNAFGKFCNELCILFIALRACDIITWPLVYVLMPVIVEIAIVIVGAIIIGVIGIKLYNKIDTEVPDWEEIIDSLGDNNDGY